jgi:hypothetical protein
LGKQQDEAFKRDYYKHSHIGTQGVIHSANLFALTRTPQGTLLSIENKTEVDLIGTARQNILWYRFVERQNLQN